MPIRRPALLVFGLLLVCALSASAQQVDFRVRVTYADTARLGPATNTNSPGVDSTRDAAGGTPVSHDAATNMQIRVQVLNSDGTTVAEQSPTTEGTARFRIVGWLQQGRDRIFLSYRVRVYGPEFEEVWVDNVEPGRADPTLDVHLHRKGEKNGPQAGAKGGMVSAANLNIPSKAQKELDKGNEELSANKLDKAAEHFQKAVEIYPKYDMAWNNLGVVKMKTGDVAGGKECFEKALAANDKSARAYVNLARMDMKDKDYKSALERANKSLAIEPLNPEALSISCQAAAIEGKNQEVIATSTKLHSVPHDGLSLCHYAAGMAFANLKKPTEATNEYKLFLKESPESALAKKAQEAIDQLNQSVQANSPQ